MKPHLLALAALAFIDCGCNPQHFRNPQPLAGNFRMTWMNSCEIRISRPEHDDSRDYVETTLPDGTIQFTGTTMLAGSVRQIAVKESFIAGFATTECAYESEAKEGYFLIDSRSEEVLYGLDEKTWKEKLAKIGWPNPDLEKPVCYFMCF